MGVPKSVTMNRLRTTALKNLMDTVKQKDVLPRTLLPRHRHTTKYMNPARSGQDNWVRLRTQPSRPTRYICWKQNPLKISLLTWPGITHASSRHCGFTSRRMSCMNQVSGDT